MLSKSSFSDRDANVLITSYLPKGDVISLIKTSRRLRGDLFYIPYKSFRFDWCSDMDTLKTFIHHAKGIEELVIDRYEFFEHFTVSLPNLKKITIEYCVMSNLKLLELYAPTLREITISNCTIDCTNFETYKYPRLQKITVDPNRMEVKTSSCSRQQLLILDRKPIDCCIIEVV